MVCLSDEEDDNEEVDVLEVVPIAFNGAVADTVQD